MRCVAQANKNVADTRGVIERTAFQFHRLSGHGAKPSAQDETAQHWLRAAFGLLAILLALTFAQPARGDNDQATLLNLTSQEQQFDAWQAARVLFDPEGRLSAEQAFQRVHTFERPAVAANLGRRTGAAWIAVPLRREAAAAKQWVLAMDYPSLDRIDLHLHTQGHLKHLATLGDTITQASGKAKTRSHAWPLTLLDDTTQTLLVRVETVGSMVVPLMLYTPPRHQAAEASEQALQGMLAGAALCLLVYSLTQWAMLRSAAFGHYALTLLGTGCFFAALSGMGAQHVWGGNAWLTQNGPPFFILVGITGAFFFTLRALEVDEVSPSTGTFVRLCGTVSGTAALAFWSELLSYQTAQAIGMALGPAPLLLVLRVAFKRLKSGDRGAAYLLAGWGCYSVGVLLLVGMLQGALPVNFWTTHGFQFASMVEMTTWLLVLGLRVHTMRLTALKTQAEHERVQQMAYTDPLTGLLNRRGLAEALPARLASATPQNMLALFDGFKGVNDRLGHEAGDDLLNGVAQRLRSQMRSNDLVCRMGGDEFVVVATGLPTERVAHQIGQKLMSCVTEPFLAGGEPCQIGMTIGYAVCPLDDTTFQGLLKRADAALYEGKRGGRNALKRGGAAVALSGA
jgi:diguanylate cyclase